MLWDVPGLKKLSRLGGSSSAPTRLRQRGGFVRSGEARSMRDLRPDRRPDLVPIHDPTYDPTYENRRTRSPDIVPDNPISYAASYAASRAASWTTTRLTLNFYLRPTATSIVRALSASYPILLCLLSTCSPRGLPTTEHCLNERVPGFLTRFSYAA